MKVINSWKIEKYPVSADAAKAEFDRIYEKYGELTTSAVVDESRDEMSVLHNCFEWDDEIAAERFRQRQAGDMIRCLVSVVVPDEEKQPLIVRAIVKTTERYEPISVAMRSEEKTAVLLQDALADIRRFKQKHGALKQLAGVFDEMRKFEDNILNGGAT